MMRLVLALLLQLAMLTLVESQSTTQPSCDSHAGDSTLCIVNHVSSKFEQLSAHDNAVLEKLDGLEMQLQSINYVSANDSGICNRNCTCPACPNVNVTNSTLPENCLDIFNNGNTASGLYTIYNPQPQLPSSEFRADYQGIIRGSMQVYCDMENYDDGARGWTVFQRREDGSVNFTMLWDGYRRGFGDLSGEHWLGNDNLNIITGESKVYELRVDLGDWEGNRRYARYSSFKVKDADSKYQLLLGNYISGDAGDSMSYHSNMSFSTPDMDNDALDSHHCARGRNMAGWWYNGCLWSALNNRYCSNSNSLSLRDNELGIIWREWHGERYSFKFTEMKIRPIH